VQLVPLTTRYNHDSQKYAKSMSLQKTYCEEAPALHPLKQPMKGAGEVERGAASSLQEVIEAAIIKTKRSILSDAGRS
jgi:hypothetical protein